MNKNQHTEYELKAFGRTWKLKEGQSPRGLRHGNNRPDLIIIDCYKIATKSDLEKHIRYLHELLNSMA